LGSNPNETEIDEEISYANAGFSLLKENSLLSKSNALAKKNYTIMNYKSLFNLIYCYRAKTEAIF